MTTTHMEHDVAESAGDPVAAEPQPAHHRSRRLVWAAVVTAALLTSTVIGAAVLPVPYVAIRPGSARPVTEQVRVEGAASYAPEHSIAYTTVKVGGTTLLEAALGWLDDDVDVIPEERVRGGRSTEEDRRYNAQLMDTSKAVAITVALRRLGYEVGVRTTGTVVRDIAADSPAAAVLQLDDVIVAVDGQPVDQPDEVGRLLQPGGPGAEHVLKVERPAGGDRTVDVTLRTVAAPADPDRALIGIAPEDRFADFDYPIHVVIDSGKVGGPSAGLAFTLAVLDVLTPGELTGGHKVAVTGTMALDGRVGPVGGAAQKAVSVEKAGYEVFLVPPEELQEVRATVGDGLRVIAVSTVQEALDALASLGGNAGSLAGARAARS